MFISVFGPCRGCTLRPAGPPECGAFAACLNAAHFKLLTARHIRSSTNRFMTISIWPCRPASPPSLPSPPGKRRRAAGPASPAGMRRRARPPQARPPQARSPAAAETRPRYRHPQLARKGRRRRSRRRAGGGGDGGLGREPAPRDAFYTADARHAADLLVVIQQARAEFCAKSVRSHLGELFANHLRVADRMS